MKNIVLCSDGTGNKGGEGAPTNVYLLYHAVKLRDTERRQFAFYNNGVGTSSNKLIRAITGAFGIGLQADVADLYEYLGRHYAPGDNIFAFGFSRGAATVRAFAGMVEHCGLLRYNWSGAEHEYFDEDVFQDLLRKAMKAYKRRNKSDNNACLTEFEGAVSDSSFVLDRDAKIEILGIWDTVSALGWPQDWSAAVDGFFRLLERVTDAIAPHSFYNYEPNHVVKNVYHALAIDDERKTFHPKVWDETKAGPEDGLQHIEQVWFCGSHSNVGGSYERAGLAYVALDWMMEKAQLHKLELEESATADATDKANPYGKMTDSRDGLAIYYRYAVRDIAALTKGLLKHQPVKIHDSVVARIKRNSAGYAPTSLPFEVEVVKTRAEDTSLVVADREPSKAIQTAISKETHRANAAAIKSTTNWRSTLYTVLAESTFVVVLAALWFWNFPPFLDVTMAPPSMLHQHIAEVLFYVLPDMMTGLIIVSVLTYPWAFWGFCLFLFLFWVARRRALTNTRKACSNARNALLDSCFPPDAVSEASSDGPGS